MSRARLRNRTVAILLPALLIVGRWISAAEIATFAVDHPDDDAYAWSDTGYNNAADYIKCGYSTAYPPPYYIGAFRFRSVAIPRHAVIRRAFLRVQCYNNGSGPSAFELVGEAYDATAPFHDPHPAIGVRAITAARVAWDVPAAWLEDQVYTSPDIASLVQEIVNRNGWTEGNALAIQIRNAADSGGQNWPYSKAGADLWGASPAQLIIEYEPPSPPPEMLLPTEIGVNGTAIIRWTSISNHRYTVYQSTNLLQGFSVLTNDLPATPPMNTYTDTVNGVRMKFWRTALLPP